MVVTALGLAACSGGSNEVSPPSLDSVVTAPPTSDSTSTSAAPSSTTDTVDTTGVSTTGAPTTTAQAGGPMFSDALGVKVDTAPGVNTPGDTRQLLPEGLYVHIAWAPDPNDPSVFTVQPDDVEILEAYANASLTFHRAAISDVTTSSPDFDRFYVDGGAQYEANFESARSGGYVGSLGSGITLRPYVLADRREADTAVVFDCTLDDGEFVLPGAEGDPDPPTEKGLVATMRRVGGMWKVDKTGGEPAACV